VGWIEASELMPRLDAAEAVAIVDVRRADEFAGPLGHIADARNVPLDELPGRAGELASLSETPVVLVCKTDRRSARAAALLAAAGFRHVLVLRGGMVSWNAAGLPIAAR
ncbi:MAG TPA: rhodanese-like domain-containing protein, partial [Hyphomicrobiaceae bacterium]